MYEQGGCLSAQAILYATTKKPQEDIKVFADVLQRTFHMETLNLEVPPVTDPASARAIREARDMALFNGATVHGDDELRWTAIFYPEPRPLEPPIGHSVVQIVPVEDVARDFAWILGPLHKYVSCVGVAGILSPEIETVLRSAGVSRICPAGEMQTPPLNWPNGNRDLSAELRRLRGTTTP
jgi:hypothetical protein